MWPIAMNVPSTSSSRAESSSMLRSSIRSSEPMPLPAASAWNSTGGTA